MNNALEISHLTKDYGAFKLDDVSLTVPGGTIMGLIGENLSLIHICWAGTARGTLRSTPTGESACGPFAPPESRTWPGRPSPLFCRERK